jgi:small multidrug resistance family-3 protein
MALLKTFALFVVTAVAEIAGCYLPWLWLRQGGSAWLLLPGAASLALFAWLLSLHPTAAGRVYAAYGGVYIGVAIVWLIVVDKVKPTLTDWVGVGLCVAGMAVIMIGPRTAP